jgi:hypothetical protein
MIRMRITGIATVGVVPCQAVMLSLELGSAPSSYPDGASLPAVLT